MRNHQAQCRLSRPGSGTLNPWPWCWPDPNPFPEFILFPRLARLERKVKR